VFCLNFFFNQKYRVVINITMVFKQNFKISTCMHSMTSSDKQFLWKFELFRYLKITKSRKTGFSQIFYNGMASFFHFFHLKFFSKRKIVYSFCLDANKRNSDLDVNNGLSGAQGRLFKILKPLIFSSTNPLATCIIYFCRKVSYSSFFLS
jgi:hypothetical protein